MQREAIGVNNATLHYLDIVYRLTFGGEAANNGEAVAVIRGTICTLFRGFKGFGLHPIGKQYINGA